MVLVEHLKHIFELKDRKKKKILRSKSLLIGTYGYLTVGVY